ncbi:MAG TPA: hypothetical protein VGF59_26500, partial [Bryobacteraceae bacterium]
GLVTRAGLPANFFVVNPQFRSAYLVDNSGNSTYNSLQIVFDKRFDRGLTFQSSYVFSKALGDGNEGDSATYFANYRTDRNKRLDKQVLSFSRAQVFKSHGIYELPFGPNKLIGGSSHGVLARVIGGWQSGFIINYFTGPPITFSGQNALNLFIGGNTATASLVSPMPAGSVQKLPNGVTYFSGLTQVVDPYVGNITTNGNLRALSTLKAIADANGKPLLVNAAPGQLGNLSAGTITGPGTFRLDMNLLKTVRINERFSMQVGANAENLSNTPQFGSPNTSINSATFGRITGSQSVPAAAGSTGSYRIIVLNARLNF